MLSARRTAIAALLLLAPAVAAAPASASQFALGSGGALTLSDGGRPSGFKG